MNLYKLEMGIIFPGIDVHCDSKGYFVSVARKKQHVGLHRLNLSTKEQPVIVPGEKLKMTIALLEKEKNNFVFKMPKENPVYKVIVLEYKYIQITNGNIEVVQHGGVKKFFVLKMYPNSSFEAWNHSGLGGKESRKFTFQDFKPNAMNR